MARTGTTVSRDGFTIFTGFGGYTVTSDALPGSRFAGSPAMTPAVLRSGQYADLGLAYVEPDGIERADGGRLSTEELEQILTDFLTSNRDALRGEEAVAAARFAAMRGQTFRYEDQVLRIGERVRVDFYNQTSKEWTTEVEAGELLAADTNGVGDWEFMIDTADGVKVVNRGKWGPGGGAGRRIVSLDWS